MQLTELESSNWFKFKQGKKIGYFTIISDGSKIGFIDDEIIYDVITKSMSPTENKFFEFFQLFKRTFD